MSRRTPHFSLLAGLAAAALFAAKPARSADALDADKPFGRMGELRPAAIEASWTPLRLPTGERIAMAGLNYYVALNDDWGLGPSIYGAAKGNYGGIFTMGVSAQRRWRIGPHSHIAAALYVGGGGGLSSDALHFGGGLMLRPEISLRNEFDKGWYSGVTWSMVRFPSGNVHGSSLGFVLGKAGDFNSFEPRDSGLRGSTSSRTGFGFDEVMVFGGFYKPGSGNRNRNGQPSRGRMGAAGAELRQYIADGSWWSLEAAGAAQGGADGYMEVLVKAGQDWALGDSGVRIGGQLGIGLGGGGNVDTGNGWLWHAGPSLRWQTPWLGASVQLTGGLARSFSGSFSAPFVRLGFGLPLDKLSPSFDGAADHSGTIRTQVLAASVQHLPRVRYKNGNEAAITELAVLMTRELTPHLYGAAQAGSAVVGDAGAYSFGLFGLGLQTAPFAGSWRAGVEGLVGAGGGGGIDVGGGAIGQVETWLQWEGDRLRLRAGLGHWGTLRSSNQASTMFNLSVGYAFGTLSR